MTPLLVLAALAALLFLCLYPAELSWLSTRGTRWLYDRAAGSYECKWARRDYGPYDEAIRRAASELAGLPQPRVLDLGCGTGRATRVAATVLGPAAEYTAVDFSPRMLGRLRAHTAAGGDLAGCRIQLVQADIGDWLAHCERSYDLVLCMEVGEFLPGFGGILARIGQRCAPGGRLVMTRPAGSWALFFPGRRQRRMPLLDGLAAAGFAGCRILPWRERYDLVRAVREVGVSPAAASPREPRSARAAR